VVRSQRASVVLSGDIMHTALQCAEPQLNSCFCGLDTLLQTPTTTLLSADEAKDRLREIVDGFFFRRLAQ